MSEHIPIDRAWILIQESMLISAAEAKHLEICRDCSEFLKSFVAVARYIGYAVRFRTWIMPLIANVRHEPLGRERVYFVGIPYGPKLINYWASEYKISY